MADFTPPQFNDQAPVNLQQNPDSSVLSAYAQATQQMLANAQAQRQQNQNTLAFVQNTVQQASQLAQSFVEASRRRQQQDAIRAYMAFNPNQQVTRIGTNPDVNPAEGEGALSADQNGNAFGPSQTTLGQTPEGQAMQRQLLGKILASNPQQSVQDIAASALPRQPTTIEAALLRQNPMANSQQLTDMKQGLLRPNASKVITAKFPDGTHNVQVDPDGTQHDLGLAGAKPTAGTGTKTINRLMPDGSTHIIQENTDGTEKDLGLAGSASTNVPSAQARASSDFAKTILPHIEEMRQLVQEADAKGLIGPGAGRVYGQFLAGKIGSTGDPANDELLGKLRATDSLLKSGALKVHFGSRGGGQMYDKFSDMLNSGKQSAAELNGALDGIESFMQGYANYGSNPPKTDMGGNWNSFNGIHYRIVK